MHLPFSTMRDRSLTSQLKILGAINLLSTFLILLTVICFSFIQFLRFNAKETQQYEASVQYSVSREESRQLHFMQDYAIWDDMVQAVRSVDQSWFESTFFGSLSTLDVKSFWIVSNGNVLFTAQAEGYVGLELPELMIKENTNDFSFFAWDHDRVFRYQVVAIQPHLSEQRLVQPAYLVSAVHWDEELLHHFGTVSQSTVSLRTQQPANSTVFSMQYSHQLPTQQNGKPEIFLHIEKENLLLLLFYRSILLAVLLFIVILVPTTIANLVMQRRWILLPLAKIRRMLTMHTNFYAPQTLTSQNELQILSMLTQEYIDQEQEAVHTSEQMKEQAARLLEANQRIREDLIHRERLSLVVEKSTNGVLITDEKMEIIYVNPSWQKLNGYKAEEVLHKTPRVVKSGKTADSVYQSMWESLNKGIPFETDEIVNLRKDGREWECHLSVYPIQEKNKTISFVGIQQDISKQKEIDRMKTDFISLASHQLRTPLSALRWFTELLLKTDQQAFSKDQRELLDNSYKSTLRMISLVNMLLNISRIESGRLIVESKPTSLITLAQEVLKELEPRSTQKQIEIRTKFPKNMENVLTDTQLVREVFANLLSNALKYSPEKSMVEIEMRLEAANVLVSVKDQGIGIPPEDKDHIFVKFYRGSNVMKTETDGTGLGLYFIKEIIQTCGGKIWFESSAGKGTTFFFTLPLQGTQGRSGEVSISPSDLG